MLGALPMEAPRDPRSIGADSADRVGIGVEGALRRLADGELVALRGDGRGRDALHLVLGAQFATSRTLDLMSRAGGGALRLALSPKRWAELEPQRSTPAARPSPEVESGWPEDAPPIAEVRARFVRQVLAGAAAGPTAAGLRAVATVPDGVLGVAEAPEAAIDLLRLADCLPVAVLAELDDAEHGVPALWERLDVGVLTIEAVAAHRRLEDAAVEQVVAIRLPTRCGEFSALGYRTSVCEREYVVLVRGELADLDPANVHLHFGCLYGDVFHSRTCPCGTRLARTMESVAARGGAIVYMPRATRCGDRRADAAASEANGVDRRVAGLILRDLGVESRVAEAA